LGLIQREYQQRVPAAIATYCLPPCRWVKDRNEMQFEIAGAAKNARYHSLKDDLSAVA
jgi:hypothetical protein